MATNQKKPITSKSKSSKKASRLFKLTHSRHTNMILFVVAFTCMGVSALLFVHAATAVRPNGVSGSWKLVFDDEFNGNKLDTKKWWPNWYKNKGTTPPDSTDDRTCYNPRQVKVQKGEVDLTAIKGGCKGHGKTYHYTSGIIQSYDKYQFKYGFMEARIWAPTHKGLWPAWWAINDNGEIDVMESFGDGVPVANYHGGVERGFARKLKNGVSGWHTYAADWEKGKVTFYYDGKAIGHITSNRITSHKMPLILNLEVGPKGDSKYAKVPATMRIDYVRVWQHK